MENFNIQITEYISGAIIIKIPATSVEAFKTLVERGCNTWVDAPAEIKFLHDAVVHGQILQEYLEIENATAPRK